LWLSANFSIALNFAEGDPATIRWLLGFQWTQILITGVYPWITAGFTCSPES